jgi:hypothetical protein
MGRVSHLITRTDHPSLSGAELSVSNKLALDSAVNVLESMTESCVQLVGAWDLGRKYLRIQGSPVRLYMRQGSTQYRTLKCLKTGPRGCEVLTHQVVQELAHVLPRRLPGYMDLLLLATASGMYMIQ